MVSDLLLMSSMLPRGVAGVCWHRESHPELPVSPPLLVRVSCLTARLQVRPEHNTLLDVSSLQGL